MTRSPLPGVQGLRRMVVAQAELKRPEIVEVKGCFWSFGVSTK